MKKLTSFILGAFIAFNLACTSGGVSTTNSHELATESRTLSGFLGIKASGSFRLIVTAGEDYSVTLEGEKAALANVVTGVDEGMLIIKSKTPAPGTSDKVRVRISVPELQKLEIYGATEAVVNGIKGSNIELSANGSSSITAEGKAGALKLVSVGACKLDTSKLPAESVTASATGASEIMTTVSKELVADAVGASTINYIGDPKVTKSVIGASDIRKQ